MSRDRRRGPHRAVLVLVFLSVGGILFTSSGREWALIALADVRSVFSPAVLSASTKEVGVRSDAVPPADGARERQLLAECLRLQLELNSLKPAAAASDRLIDVEAVRGIVLWGNADDRQAVVSLGTAADVTGEFMGQLVVADVAIDLGQRDGIEVDSLALNGRTVVGRVSRVGWRSCSLTSSHSSDFVVPAEIVRVSGDRVIAGAIGRYRGDDAGGGILEYVKAESPVSVGDEVYTIPHSIWAGQRLHLGTITSVELPAGEPHWKIEVTPSGQPSSGMSVLVLRPRLRWSGQGEDSDASQRGEAP